MEHPSQAAAKLIRELTELTDCLAERDIVVSSLQVEPSAFGGWVLVAEKRHEAIRFTWDGRDGFLTIESSPMPDNRRPKEWRQELLKGFDIVSGNSPVRFVVEYLKKRFPA